MVIEVIFEIGLGFAYLISRSSIDVKKQGSFSRVLGFWAGAIESVSCEVRYVDDGPDLYTFCPGRCRQSEAVGGCR